MYLNDCAQSGQLLYELIEPRSCGLEEMIKLFFVQGRIKKTKTEPTFCYGGFQLRIKNYQAITLVFV